MSQGSRETPRPASEAAISSAQLREPSVDIELDTTDPRPSAELSPELATLRKFAGYEMLGRLAVGGMAEVFVARERSQAGGARLLALKVVRAHLEGDASFSDMFLREGQVALGLRHPNICHVYRFGVQEGHCFLAMELVSGITVQDLLVRASKARLPVPTPVAVKIASAVAEALHSAHTAKDSRGRALQVVHQDVSPHNLMVAYDGTVKLLDFGVAHSTLENAAASAATGAEPSHTTIRGKFAYLAPEQCRGAEVDPRTDVFSLGICLFEMLTRRRLFKRASSMEMLNAVVSEPMPSPSSLGVDLPEPLVRVLERALQKAPRDRYQTAAEMQEDLERFLADERLVVTSTKISEYLVELLGDEVNRPPSLDTRPEVVAWLRGSPTSLPPPPVTRAASPRKGMAIGAIVLAIAVVGLAIAASLGGSSEPTATATIPAPAHGTTPITEAPLGDSPLAEPPPAPAVEATPIAAIVEPEPPPEETVAAPEADPVLEEDPARRARHRRRAATKAAPGGFVENPGF